MTRAGAYLPNPIRDYRRSRVDGDAIRWAIDEMIEAGNPMTVRHAFFQLVGRGDRK